MKRAALVGCFIFLASALGVLVGPLIVAEKSVGSGICKSNYDRLEIGMTKKEVEEVFGCTSGDYTTAPWLSSEIPVFFGPVPTCWISDGGAARMVFLEEVISEKSFYEIVLVREPTWCERILKLIDRRVQLFLNQAKASRVCLGIF